MTAGTSVALVLVPQALAYAELAGMDAVVGLLAASLPLLAAAPLASSPYLQTGPTALIALLTFGILSTYYVPGTDEYLAAAALLALLVGLLRVVLGLLRFGTIAYFMSEPVMSGFTTAAALIIVLSQLPAALGATSTSVNAVQGAIDVLTDPGGWNYGAILFSVATIIVILTATRISPLLPGVLVTVVLGVVVSSVSGYTGPTVGDVSGPILQLDLVIPWGDASNLLLGAIVIAIVGFAEPAAIARAYAGRRAWDPDRELISQGAANLVSGVLGAFPVGGSFSRSALNHSAGAATRWSGFVTGLVVLAVLPVVGLLSALPKAVLAGVVIASVVKLLQFRPLLKLWRYTRLQALTAYITFFLVLLLAPRIDVAVVIGVGMAIAAHLYRELDLGIKVSEEGGTMHLRLSGVLWFGSTHVLEEYIGELFPPGEGVSRLVVDTSRLGRVDLSGALVLDQLLDEAEKHGLELEVVGLGERAQKVFDRVRRS